MADLGSNRQWLVDPDHEVKKMWMDVQIQERKSRISKLNQDIEDLLKGKVLEIQATIKMLEKELFELQSRRDAVEL